MNADESMPIWLKKRAYLTPERIALKIKGKTWSFAELDHLAQQTAMRLKAIGIEEGQLVGLLLENDFDMVCYFHALQYIGAVMVPLNTRLTVNELTWQLKDCKASLLIYDSAHIHQAADIKEQSHFLVMSKDEVEEQRIKQPTALKESIQLSNVQTIVYTSGTTGSPKGVLLTYGNHWWSAVSSALNLGLNHDDIWLASVPLFHVSGLSILVKSVVYGMTVHLLSPFSPHDVNEAICNEGITMVSVVSVMLKQLLEDLGDSVYPNSFRCMLLGGGPAPGPLLERCKEKQIPIYQTYGLSETASQIVTLSPEYMLSKLGSAGKPLFPSEIKIMKSRSEGESKPNEPGEIVVKGPNVTRGYLNNETATKETISDGWLYTGDIGFVDEEGFLYVLDRRKDLIISGGENIYPAEIEAVLLKHPGIDEAGVTGLPDEKWGMVPVAFIKAKSGFNWDEERMINFCQMNLAKYKVPRAIYAVEHLPRNASNKLLRRKLLELLPENK